jgi:hypothetical protein
MSIVCTQCSIWLFSLVLCCRVFKLCCSDIFLIILWCFEFSLLLLVSISAVRSLLFKIFRLPYWSNFWLHKSPFIRVLINRYVPFALSRIMMGCLLLGMDLSSLVGSSIWLALSHHHYYHRHHHCHHYV